MQIPSLGTLESCDDILSALVGSIFSCYSAQRLYRKPSRMVSDYEKQKAASIARVIELLKYIDCHLTVQQNKQLLQSLGLDRPLIEPNLKKETKRKYAPETERVDAPTPKIKRITVQIDMESEPIALRRSSRNSGKKVDYSGSQGTGLPQPLIHNKRSENEGPMGREAGQRIHNPLSRSLAFEVVAILISALCSGRPMDIFQVLLLVPGG